MSGSKPLLNKICLVTGATRGIGRGIALQLGEAGATVYVTGRTLEPDSSDSRTSSAGGSLKETVDEINARGGRGVGVRCDHKNDDDIRALFEQLEREQNGQLDVLVNNAYSAVGFIARNSGKKFWEQPLEAWDEVNRVGLRNHYLCSVLGARMMVKRASGLIVNVSSAGGLRYIFNVAYGVGKAALDRMAADMAVELRGTGVSIVSLWPGAVQTEEIMSMLKGGGGAEQESLGGDFKRMERMFENGESTEFAGRAVAALAADSQVGRKSGRILLTAELGDEYGFSDIGGRRICSLRSVSHLLNQLGYGYIGWLVPGFVRLPYWLLALAASKF